MANISSAFGTVTVYAENIGIINRIMVAHSENQKKAYYDTTIDADQPNSIGRPACHITSSGEDYQLNVPLSMTFNFSGQGRWNFESNVGWFIDNILEQDHELKNHFFGAIFEFTDSEPGIGFIYNAVMKTEYNPVSENISTDTLEESDSVDYTARNLVEYGFFSEDEVVDQEWILENRETAIVHLKEDMNNLPDDVFKKQLAFLIDNPENLFMIVKAEDYGVYDSVLDYLALIDLDEYDICA